MKPMLSRAGTSVLKTTQVRARAASAREVVDFTVPRLTPMASAVSCSGRSAK